MHGLTIDDLRCRREKALLCAGRAVSFNQGAYRELKELIHTINSSLLDIAQYNSTATQLGSLLAEIDNGRETIFAYFRDRIDPRKKGRAADFRFECRDLAEQIADLDHWRWARHGLRRVK